MVNTTTATTSPLTSTSSSPVQESRTFSTMKSSPASSSADLCQWVDYLPCQLNPKQDPSTPNATLDQEVENNNRGFCKKRPSMDPSETNITEKSNDESMEEDDGIDWPDSNSLEGYNMLPPALLLGEGDVMMQHELLLDSASSYSHGEDPSVAPELFANSLEELLEQRKRQLMASMHASMRTRQFLEPHIKQRAGLANVLTQIERSSLTVQEHLHLQEAAPSPVSTEASVSVDDLDEHMDTVDAADVEDFAASVLVDDAEVLVHDEPMLP